LIGTVRERVDTRVLQFLYTVQELKDKFLVGQQVDVFIGRSDPDSPATPAC
jgi:hypothetical protein